MSFEPRRFSRNSSDAQSSSHAQRSEPMFTICCIVAVMFQFRDTTSGALRFYLEAAHLSVLWFIPDVLCLVPLVYFARVTVLANRSIFGWVLLANFIGSTAIGIAMMSSGPIAIISSVKLFLPLFCGFVFTGRSLTETSWMRWAIGAMMMLSVVGVIGNIFIDFPWVGAEINNFGYTKVAARLWWSQGDMRYGGFSGDSTAAAYLSMFPYFLLYRHLSKPVQIALWLPIGAAVWYTTSKTAILTGSLFILYYIVMHLVVPAKRTELTRALAKLSFLLVPVPFVLILTLSGFDLGSVSPMLFSLGDRINNTWVFPFSYLADVFPVGIITGCGLGCFTYPMNYTEMAPLNVPVDNFYLASYIMLGAPFLVTVVGMFTSTYKTNDPAKLILVIMGNIYSVTVQCYGPSAVGVIMAYGFSDMFETKRRDWRRGSRLGEPAARLDGPDTPKLIGHHRASQIRVKITRLIAMRVDRTSPPRSGLISDAIGAEGEVRIKRSYVLGARLARSTR
jgi:hypothetical protein